MATATCAEPTPIDPVDPAPVAPVQPEPPVVLGVWFCPAIPPPLAQIYNMHACDKTEPMLFGRGGMFEYESYALLHEIERQLMDKELLHEAVHGKSAAVARVLWLLNEASNIYNTYQKFPGQPTDDSDLQVLRDFIKDVTPPIEQKLTLLPWATPDPGFAYVMEYEVVFPESHLTRTGHCDRNTVLHEMTHFMQLHFAAESFEFTKETDPNGELHTIELAAMIVETAEAIRQGLTAKMLDDSCHALSFKESIPDLHWGMDYHDIRDHADLEAPPRAVRLPAMDGYLLYEYVVKYGPHFTGCMKCDLEILKTWTHDFESVGKYRLKTLPPDLARDWQTVTRLQVGSGEVSPMASTCQTWLSIQGAPSFYPPVVPIPLSERMASDPVAGVPDMTELYLRLSGTTTHEDFTRACDFLMRLQANGAR